MLGVLGRAARAEEPTLRLAVIGPQSASPFKLQLKVQVSNESFVSYPLQEKFEASQLLIDGKPYPRQDVLFDGPAGLAAQGTWEGCVGLEDYAPGALAPGRHHVVLLLGNARSDEVRVEIPKAQAAADTPKERLKQAGALRGALAPGLGKRCVENWLTVRDGGLEIAHTVRYYLEPDVKVLVPYDETLPEPRINGPVMIYNESRVAD